MHRNSGRGGCGKIHVTTLSGRATRDSQGNNTTKNICDHTRDWEQIADTTEGWGLCDPAATMLDLDKFGTELKKRIEYAKCQMGWNIDIRKAGWAGPTNGISRLRYWHWRERPLL